VLRNNAQQEAAKVNPGSEQNRTTKGSIQLEDLLLNSQWLENATLGHLTPVARLGRDPWSSRLKNNDDNTTMYSYPSASRATVLQKAAKSAYCGRDASRADDDEGRSAPVGACHSQSNYSDQRMMAPICARSDRRRSPISTFSLRVHTTWYTVLV
jgi:hypothetical protein